MEALDRTLYIVIFPDKCIPRTFASKCMPMFLSWFRLQIKDRYSNHFLGATRKEKYSNFLAAVKHSGKYTFLDHVK